MASFLTQVFVQTWDNIIASEPSYAAWAGFAAKGYDIVFYDWKDMKAGQCPLSRTTLVVGAVSCVNFALKQIGVDPPAEYNLPECLAAYRGRKVWTTNWGDVHRQFLKGRKEPIFVKPLSASKAFNGYVISNLADLEPTMKFPAHMELLASDRVEFLSEWRYCVHRNQIIGVGHYAGSFFHPPDAEVVQAAVRDFQLTAPVAYAIDFGVTKEGKTLLVEVNDAYGLGCYGLHPSKYAAMLEDRWLEIVGLDRHAKSTELKA